MRNHLLIIAVALLAAVSQTLFGAPQATTTPVTTTSKEALQQYEKGVDLADRALFPEATACFTKAVELDPEFSMAYYQLAGIANSFRETQDYFTKAMAHADHVTEGERLVLQTMKAGLDNNRVKQEELARKVVAMYPEDKHARMNLGAILYNHRDYAAAVDELNRCVRIDPKFVAAYNLIGYANMSLEKFPEAETAFKTYTDLVPNDANPHDSYAEFLMKEGKFDESITEYQKSLTLDPKFYSSYIGIAADFTFKGMPVEARKQLQKLYDLAPEAGWKEQALYAMVTTSLHEGNYARAIKEADRVDSIASRDNDVRGVAGNQNLIGQILLEMSAIDMNKGTYLKTREPETAKVDEAATHFNNAAATIASATVDQDVKNREMDDHLFFLTQVDLRKNDIASARQHASQFTARVTAQNDPIEIQQTHQLEGMIALADKRYPDAIKELKGSNLHDAMNMCRLADAYEGAGNTTEAQTIRTKVWNLNENTLSLAFVRRMVKQ